MKKRVIAMLMAVVLVLGNISIGGVYVGAKEKLKSINPIIDVGNKIYVQHDANNNDVFELKKSGTGTTIVYEQMFPEFTANKVWLKNGKFADNTNKKPSGEYVPHGATAPDKYIPVKEGEEYFVKLYGVGGMGESCYVPILFLDDNNKVIGDALTNTHSSSKEGKVVTVPKGATRMHLTDFNHQNLTLQKVLRLSDKEFDQLPFTCKKEKLEAEIDAKYKEYVKDKTLYKNTDKAYITFVNDDTRSPIDQFADVFISKKVPLVLATVPSNLMDNASSQKETRLQVARRVVNAGGEVMAHYATPLTEEGFSNYNTMYSLFVRTKQALQSYDFEVNGIILSGGQGQVTGDPRSEKWVSSLYSYSDLYGVQYKKNEYAFDSVYHHGRGGLGNFWNNIDKIKQAIDKGISEKSWTVFYFHDDNEISTKTMEAVLDYVNQKCKSGELEAVTYKEMYEKNAQKESKMKSANATYYVSSTGTSLVGKDKDHPMSYETAKSRTFLSGDTILFKRGDTFYGSFYPKINKINDKKTTISSYGTGALPNICGYKIADRKDCWIEHGKGQGLYQINLKDKRYFNGVQAVDANSINIGFIEDKNGKKYYSKKSSLSELKNQYDFFCDDTFLYIKTDKNPYEDLGTLKLAPKAQALLYVSSNLKVENLKISGTGGHGILGADKTTENVEIVNNVIEDIGGSYLKASTRYGNGIEFYGTNVKDVVVKNNVIRNTYDVGFTIQGTEGSGNNVIVENNVFVSNTQDSEIWESGSATGVRGYEFRNNISVNQGRGWGYEARPDKYAAAHILFWGYGIENTDIYFHHNLVYNPIRIYFIEQTNKTDQFFKNKNVIKSDYNTYLLTSEARIFRHLFVVSQSDSFVSEFKKDMHSTFTKLEKVDENIVATATTSDDVRVIKKLFGVEQEESKLNPSEPNPSEPSTSEPSTSEPSTSEPNTSEPSTSEPSTSEPSTSEPNTDPNQPSTPNNTNVPKAGTKITNKKTKVVYQVKKANQNTGTIKYVTCTNKKVTKITVPTTVKVGSITYKVTDIAPKAFKNNKKIKTVTVGKNVTIIGIEAFANCSSLTKVTLPANLTTVGSNAFNGCSKLKSITIPTKVNKIGTNAFKNCKSLTTITIQSKLLTSKNVSKNAFSGISSKVTIKVPKSKLKEYNKLFKQKGLNKKVKVKAI